MVCFCNVKLILLSYVRVNIGDFMKIAEIVKNSFNNTSFIATKKASNMAMSVSWFINIHKLRCHMIHNYCYSTISVFVKMLKVLVNNREITVCIPKLRQKQIV